jgi:hypothetical protein
MSDEPVFPKPRPKGSAYREAAPVPAEPTKPKVVATRPEPPTEPGPIVLASSEPNKLAPEHLLVPMAAERTYWHKQQFIVRHPRITGAAFFVGSIVLLVPSVVSRIEGHRYGASSTTVSGSIFLTTSLWLLVAGAPLRADGRPPPWWSTGIGVCAVVGGVVGLFLLG